MAVPADNGKRVYTDLHRRAPADEEHVYMSPLDYEEPSEL